MRKEPPASGRELATERLSADLVVVGGGMAGTCCALTAARAGVRVVLCRTGRSWVATRRASAVVGAGCDFAHGEQ